MGDLCIKKEIGALDQGDGNTIGRHNRFQMGADMDVQRFKTFIEVAMIVQRERAGVRIERECAQRGA